jgi:hypothetical protein
MMDDKQDKECGSSEEWKKKKEVALNNFSTNWCSIGIGKVTLDRRRVEGSIESYRPDRLFTF